MVCSTLISWLQTTHFQLFMIISQRRMHTVSWVMFSWIIRYTASRLCASTLTLVPTTLTLSHSTRLCQVLVVLGWIAMLWVGASIRRALVLTTTTFWSSTVTTTSHSASTLSMLLLVTLGSTFTVVVTHTATLIRITKRTLATILHSVLRRASSYHSSVV